MDENFKNLRDVCGALLSVLLDKKIVTLEEWHEYIIQAKSIIEQEDAKALEKQISEMSSGEKFLYDIFNKNS